MEQFLDDPVAFVDVGLVAGGFVIHRFWRWRQAVALRRQADEQGWQSADGQDAFGEVVIDLVPELHEPELHEQADQDARAAARSVLSNHAGPGLRVRVGPSRRGHSSVRSHNVHRIPVNEGEGAAGNVAVAAQVGKVTGGRTTRHRGAVLARAPVELPHVRLVSRLWMDRDGDGVLPAALSATFNDQTLDSGARAAYLDALVVADQSVVVVCSGPLEAGRIEGQVTAVSNSLDRAIRVQPSSDASGPVRLNDPLPAA